jgi:hypothetical protein
MFCLSPPATLAGLCGEPTRDLEIVASAGVIAGLLMGRGLLYWQVGAAVDWNPSLELGVISVSFRSDFLGRILLFSWLSFGVTLVVFYLWLLFLSLVNNAVEANSIQRWIDRHLGWFGRTY